MDKKEVLVCNDHYASIFENLYYSIKSIESAQKNLNNILSVLKVIETSECSLSFGDPIDIFEDVETVLNDHLYKAVDLLNKVTDKVK